MEENRCMVVSKIYVHFTRRRSSIKANIKIHVRTHPIWKKNHRSLSMVPRKDHAKSGKSYLPYVINSLNILLYVVFWVKINVFKDEVYLCYFCYYTQIKIRLVTFFFTNKVCKKVRYQNTLSHVNMRFVINHIAQWKI